MGGRLIAAPTTAPEPLPGSRLAQRPRVRPHGLHPSPTPAQALSYYCGASKFVRVGVSLDTLRPIYGGTAKCKAPRVVVPCVEVDLDMREVALLGAAATVTR